MLAILHQQNQQAVEEDQEGSEDGSLLDQETEEEPEPRQRGLPDEAVPADEPVAQAEAHLVGKADGAATEGQDPELQNALAAETKDKVSYAAS